MLKDIQIGDKLDNNLTVLDIFGGEKRPKTPQKEV